MHVPAGSWHAASGIARCLACELLRILGMVYYGRRWTVAGGVLTAPLLLVAVAQALGWRLAGLLPEDAAVHLCIAWGIGTLMGYLTDSLRR